MLEVSFCCMFAECFLLAWKEFMKNFKKFASRNGCKNAKWVHKNG